MSTDTDSPQAMPTPATTADSHHVHIYRREVDKCEGSGGRARNTFGRPPRGGVIHGPKPPYGARPVYRITPSRASYGFRNIFRFSKSRRWSA